MVQVDADQKRVLLVVDAFPPQLGGRAERMAYRARYLASHGWQVVVLAPATTAMGQQAALTACSPDTAGGAERVQPDRGISVYRTTYLFKDRWPSLKHNVGRRLDVQQGGLPRIVDFLAVPRGYIRWLPYAIVEGRKLASSVDVLLTVNNPVMLHLVGLILSRWTGKPWAAEFRDPLVGYAYSRRGPEWVNRRLESLTVHEADCIIRLRDFCPDPMEERYPDMLPDKFVTIPFSGYDPDAFNASTLHAYQHKDGEPLQIAYTGSFYGDSITPIPFFRGLKQFLEGSEAGRQSVRIVFAGDWDAQYDRVLVDWGLDDCVVYAGYLTRQECLNLYQESHLLLIVLGMEQDNRMRIPSKFWDYLAARRSMLALVQTDSLLARLVKEEEMGFVADGSDKAAIAATLDEIWQAYCRGSLAPRPSAEFLAQTTRTRSEKVILDTLNRLVKP